LHFGYLFIYFWAYSDKCIFAKKKAKVRNIGTTLKLRQASRAQLIHLLTALREKAKEQKQKKDSKL